MKLKATILIILSVTLASGGVWSTDQFFGESSIRPLFDRADLIVHGEVVSRPLSITHSGKSRTPLDLRVIDTIKGSLTNTHIRVVVITHSTGSAVRDVTNGCRRVFFLMSSLESCDPWFSVQAEDPSLLWALRAMVDEDKQRGPTTD